MQAKYLKVLCAQNCVVRRNNFTKKLCFGDILSIHDFFAEGKKRKGWLGTEGVGVVGLGRSLAQNILRISLMCTG